ncbi:hypothetical protein DFH07DRAFT_770893 [Mycena maculata]|uniref:Uncharacterized protein n=1 Tax=Mycena maculata TaxID=230809 RepID=A0AAD7JFC9_9AGAR|nr:hypothetical protein DFH07DRAFT_770893 [Mycena maculata]
MSRVSIWSGGMCQLAAPSSQQLIKTLQPTEKDYIGIGLLGAAIMIYVAHHKRPSTRLDHLNKVITEETEILERASAECLRDHVCLTAARRQLLQVKWSASNIQSRRLETESMSWKIYLQEMWDISLNLDKCESQLTMEAKHQRKLSEDINETEKILNAVVHSPIEGHGRFFNNSEYGHRIYQEGAR